MFYKNCCDIIIVSNDEYIIGGTSKSTFSWYFPNSRQICDNTEDEGLEITAELAVAIRT